MSQLDLQGRAREARRKAKCIEAEMRAAHLERLQQRQQRLTESYEAWEWISGWQDVVDRMRGPERDLVQPVSTAQDRRYGANWPFWRTWIEHARLRAAGRILCTLTNVGRGLVRGLCSYVVRDGYTFRAAARSDSTPAALVGAVQAAIDDFSDHNEWPEYQQELFRRDRRDGESFTRYFTAKDGMLTLRAVNPEQVLEPPAMRPETDSFGILTQEDDTLSVTGYWVAYDGNASAGEEVPADEMLHSKANVDREVKRGLSDFSYDTYDAIKSVGSLLEAMSEGSAIQASIAFFRQHEGSGIDQVSEFLGAVKDYEQLNPRTGKLDRQEQYYPGKIIDMPKGMTVSTPPFATNAQNFTAVAQAVLRNVGVGLWNAPEWLVSGDASNGNYASSLVAEAPFGRTCMAAQAFYSARFKRPVTAAIKARCDAGKLRAGGRTWSWDEVRTQVDIEVEPPTLTVRDPLQEAQRHQIEIQAGTNSPQNVCQEMGRDYERITTDLEEHQERTGGGAGGGLSLPGEGGAGGLAGDDQGDDQLGQRGDPFADLDGPQGMPGAEGDSGALRATVGGSQAILDLQTAVYAGTLPREAAVANATIVFGFDSQEAEALFPLVAPQRMTDEIGEAVRTDKRGYKYCIDDSSGKRAACAPSDVKGVKTITHQQVYSRIQELRRAGPLDADGVVSVTKLMARLPVADLRELNKRLSAGAGNAKTHRALVEKIKERALGVKPEPAAPKVEVGGPGFTGRDSLGREWVSGKLVAAKEEPKKPREKAAQEQPQPSAAPAQGDAGGGAKGAGAQEVSPELRAAADKVLARPKGNTAAPKRGEAGEALHALTDEQIRAAKFAPIEVPGGSLNGKFIGAVTVGGRKLFYKGLEDDVAAHEALVAGLFEQTGLRAPAVRAGAVAGAPKRRGASGGALAEWVEGDTVGALLASGEAFARLESRLRPGEIDRHAMFSFLLALEDRHNGNYMVEGDRLVSIDHEFSLGRTMDRIGNPVEFADPDEEAAEKLLVRGPLRFRYGGGGLGSEKYAPRDAPISPRAAREVASVAGRIAQAVEGADPRRGAIVRRHARALEDFAGGEVHTIGTLLDLLGERRP